MRLVCLLLLAGCGRIGYESHDLDGPPADAAPTVVFGGEGDNAVQDVVIDPEGYVYLTGFFGGTGDFGGMALTSVGGHDIFLLALGPDGGVRWARGYGGAARDEGEGVAVDGAGNVYLTGYFGGTVDFGAAVLTSSGFDDIVLASYQRDGTPRFAKNFGDNLPDTGYGNDRGRRVAIDPTGQVVLAATFRGTVDVGTGPLTSVSPEGYDVLLAAFDENGNGKWAKRFGVSYLNSPYDAAFDAAGDIILSGFYDGAIDFGGGPLPTHGGQDAFVASFDRNGGYRWARGLGGPGFEYVESIVATPAGEVIATGFFEDTADFGTGPLVSAGDRDMFVARFHADGTTAFAERFGGPGCDNARANERDAAGRLRVTGWFSDTIDLGGPLSSAGGLDGFVAELAEDGSVVSASRFGGPMNDGGRALAAGAGTTLVAGFLDGVVACANDWGAHSFLTRL